MRTHTKIMAAAGILIGAQGAWAQYAANDLMLGFNRVDNGGVGPQPADYVINLGNYQSAVGVGGGVVVNLTGSFNPSTFSSLYGSLSSGVSMSVVGGKGASAGRDLFATVLRSGLGTPSVAGSAPPDALLSVFMGSGANDVGAMGGLSGLNLSGGMSTTVAQSDPSSFNTWVLGTAPPSFASGTGIDPSGSTAGSVLYEDLYRAQDGVNGNSFEYLGYFTLDLSQNASLTFTPLAVPEPSVLGFLAIGGSLLLLAQRRRGNSLAANNSIGH